MVLILDSTVVAASMSTERLIQNPGVREKHVEVFGFVYCKLSILPTEKF